MGRGSWHRLAFRDANEEVLCRLREQLLECPLPVTPLVNRPYFHSVSFTGPGGLLFELATATPGISVDESLTALGSYLRLPPHLEQYFRELALASDRVLSPR